MTRPALPLDGGSPLELEAKLGEERNGGIEGLDHDAGVVHPLERHIIWPHSDRKPASVWKNVRRLAGWIPGWVMMRHLTADDERRGLAIGHRIAVRRCRGRITYVR